jgi:hypothetical protein
MRKLLSLLLLCLLAACNLPIQASAPASGVVQTQPSGPLYVGDQVSFEVLPPSSAPGALAVRLSQGEKSLGETNFEPFGLENRRQATFYWAWDTRGLAAGDYTLTFTLLPGGASWNETFSLHPAAEVPAPEPNARWETVETDCCVLHYIRGTQAETDLESLKISAETEAADVEARLGLQRGKKIPITFLPRVLGHGGFTSDAIYVSYLAQNYAGKNARQVLHHEMVHWLDSQVPSGLRPSILQEGLAVYLSGGHFKPEPILPRAAALPGLGWYTPLRQLANNFYLSQHETSYTEAAALIDYLITTYGKDEFDTFYRKIQPAPDGSQASALEAALQAHFHLSLAELDQNFLDFLRRQPVDETARTDLRLTVAYYDTVRRYQQLLDPSAYFLTAWLPNPAEMRQRGIVADFLRHPQALLNRQIETRLVAADANLQAGNYPQVEAELNLINRWLAWYAAWAQ